MSEEWTKTDMAMGLGALAAVWADVDSTKKALARDSTELNPLIGSKPSDAQINMAGGLAATAIILGADTMPKKYRKPFLAGMTAMRAVVADQNHKGTAFKNFGSAMKKPIIAGLAAALLGHAVLGEKGLLSITPQGNVNLEMKF